MMSGDTRDGFTVQEFCQRNGISRTTFYAEVSDGKLIARKARGRTIVLDSDARAWRDALPKLEPATA
jgi:hypothetical protein